MALISIKRNKAGLIAVIAPYQLKDTLKASPGARWDKDSGCWTYPWSAKALTSLKGALGDLWDITNLSPKVQALFDESNQLTQHVERVRETAEGLAPIPMTVYRPWNHQLQAYHFAYPLPGCLLNMAVGTGKSKVTIDLMMNRRTHANLIFGPKKVVENVWEHQLNEHWGEEAGPLNYVIQAGDSARFQKRVEALMQEPEPFVAITTYQTAWRSGFADWAIKQRWGTVTLDEIHRAKAPGGKASMFFSKLGQQTDFRLGLSGTPIPNGLQDSYGIYRFLDPGIFGTNYQRFCDRHVVFGGFNNYQIMGYVNEEEWNRKFYSIAFRVDDDVLDLPIAREVLYLCDLDDSVKSTYKSLKKEFIAEVKGKTISAKNVLAKMVRLQQITSGFMQMDVEEGEEKDTQPLETNPKLSLLADTLADMAIDEPIVIFYRFTPDATNIRRLLEELGRSVAEVSGSADELKDWQAGDKDVVMVQVQSGNEGNDFTRTRYAIFYSMTYSWGDFVQSKGRVRRPGQKRQPEFIRLAVKGTIDEDIWKALDNKTDVIDWVLRGINGS